jgi:hypothetical protein
MGPKALAAVWRDGKTPIIGSTGPEGKSTSPPLWKCAKVPPPPQGISPLLGFPTEDSRFIEGPAVSTEAVRRSRPALHRYPGDERQGWGIRHFSYAAYAANTIPATAPILRPARSLRSPAPPCSGPSRRLLLPASAARIPPRPREMQPAGHCASVCSSQRATA